jgi:NitT/TauT family transport system substrate-binding protein
VDAVIAWSTFAQEIRKRMGARVIEWQAQAAQASFGVLSARNDWIGGHQETIERFLKSLSEAERTVAGRPEETKAILQRVMGYDDVSLEKAWSEHEFTLTLDQSLILAMEDEIRWMMDNNLTTVGAVPSLLKFIHTSSLKSVKPDAVRIPGE